MADNSQSYTKKKKREKWTIVRLVVGDRWVLIQVHASCSGLSKEPIFNRNEEMETENLSTAASRFGPRSATELVGDK